jgi:hypothetical protein
MMSKTPIFIYNSFNRGFATGILGCKIFGVLGTVSLMNKINSGKRIKTCESSAAVWHWRWAHKRK